MKFHRAKKQKMVENILKNLLTKASERAMMNELRPKGQQREP